MDLGQFDEFIGRDNHLIVGMDGRPWRGIRKGDDRTGRYLLNRVWMSQRKKMVVLGSSSSGMAEVEGGGQLAPCFAHVNIPGEEMDGVGKTSEIEVCDGRIVLTVCVQLVCPASLCQPRPPSTVLSAARRPYGTSSP